MVPGLVLVISFLGWWDAYWLCQKEGLGGLVASFILGGESSSGVGFTGGAGVGLAGGNRWVWWQRFGGTC